MTITHVRKTPEEVAAWVKDKLPGWEYYSDYINCDSRLKIKHECGLVREVSGISIKNRKIRCPDCYSKECEQRRIERKKQKKIERTEQRKIEKLNKRKPLKEIQIPMLFQSCSMCGLTFVDSRKRKYCSEKCASVKSRTASWRKRELYRYKVPLDQLAKRDKNICYLCGERVDWSDFKEDENGYLIFGDNYPSRDHVVPRALGGADTWENIKLAHRGCNCKKGVAVI